MVLGVVEFNKNTDHREKERRLKTKPQFVLGVEACDTSSLLCVKVSRGRASTTSCLLPLRLSSMGDS